MLKWINKKRNTKGFTLIELIVVIAILGILAAIAIPRLTGFQEKAKISADIATYETLNSSIAIYVADGSITKDVAVTTDDKGVLTITPHTDDSIVQADILDGATTLKLKKNASLETKWVVASGKITPPGIDLTDATTRGEWK